MLCMLILSYPDSQKWALKCFGITYGRIKVCLTQEVKDNFDVLVNASLPFDSSNKLIHF